MNHILFDCMTSFLVWKGRKGQYQFVNDHNFGQRSQLLLEHRKRKTNKQKTTSFAQIWYYVGMVID